MTKEELDAALAAMPHLRTNPAPTPQPLGFDFAAEPAADREADRAHREKLYREAWHARVDASRAELEGRLGETLKGALRGAQTPCALLLGPTGCGKTSGALFLTALARNRTTVVRARDLSNAERRHPLGQGIPPEITRAQDATYLVIDDLGSEGSDTGSIQDVLDLRYSRGSAVIVTTGLTMAELAAHIGPAYVRRIVDQHVRRADGTEFPVLVVDCHD